MAGIVNTSGTGIYSTLEPIWFFLIGTSTNLQSLASTQNSVTFEGTTIDASDTIHPVTISFPATPGLITGTTCMMAQEVQDSSDIFSINNQPVTNSGSKKVQNLGNAPIVPMSLSSGHNARFYIAK